MPAPEKASGKILLRCSNCGKLSGNPQASYLVPDFHGKKARLCYR